MRLRMPYRGLTHSLRFLRKQVMEGVPYAQQQMPQLNTPKEVFHYLKGKTKYRHDPHRKELFQTLPSLMEDNYHGEPGRGDCDCFTIAALSSMLANGIYDTGIVLAGRNPKNAVHIYAYADDQDGKRKYLDLTNSQFDYERYYPYKQHIPLVLNPNEKKDMELLLHEGNETLSNYYTRHHSRKPMLSPQEIGYVQLRDGVQIREDYWDGLNASEFADAMLSEGMSADDILTLSSRRSQRKAGKAAKKASKPRTQRKNARIDKIKAKAEAKRLRAQAKLKNAEQGGGSWFDKLTDTVKGFIPGGDQDQDDTGTTTTNRIITDQDEADQKAPTTTKVMDKYGNVIGKMDGSKMVPSGGDDDEDQGLINPEKGRQGGDDGTGKVSPKKQTPPPDTMKIFGHDVPKKHVVVGGIILGVVAIGVTSAVVIHNKKKKRRRLAA